MTPSPCWYGTRDGWERGKLHQWTMQGRYPVGIVEDKDGMCHTMSVENISLGERDPSEVLREIRRAEWDRDIEVMREIRESLEASKIASN